LELLCGTGSPWRVIIAANKVAVAEAKSETMSIFSQLIDASTWLWSSGFQKAQVEEDAHEAVEETGEIIDEASEALSAATTMRAWCDDAYVNS
ncbi:hypothetical protein GN156_27875, partial [bacterium LRH843]|nr:hypothetical protein [bacterium LRH843]